MKNLLRCQFCFRLDDSCENQREGITCVLPRRVSGVFVQAPLKGEIFMHPPSGCGELPRKVVQLLKCLRSQAGWLRVGHVTGEQVDK